MHPMTPWAEKLRNEDRRTGERALLLRYPLWAIRVEFEEEPVELDFDTAADYDLAPDDLVSDDMHACQAFADDQRSSGMRTFTAPSAALPGTRNLVVMDPAVVIAYESEPLGPEDLPTSMASQDGRCPEGLWDAVHYRHAGTPHAGFETWLTGDEFAFEEPVVTAGSLLA